MKNTIPNHDPVTSRRAKVGHPGQASSARVVARTAGIVSCLLFGSLAYGQTADDASAEDPVFELSPFEVNPEGDAGFAAVNAGTATKLGVQMKDLAAPYSVLTGEFIEAVGITNLQEAVNWSTNGAPVIDAQGADLFLVPSMYNVRGQVINQGQQRNFFLTASVSDSYSVERIDFGRGPNAVLFNVGANSVLGGGISTQTKQARVGRDFGEVALTVGSWDKFRTTLDLNESITERFALRLNALYEDSGGYLDSEMHDAEGITLAGAFQASENTRFRFEILNDKIRRSNPPGPYFDNLSGWDGETTFDAPITNADFATWQNQGSNQGVWREGNNAYVYVPGQGMVMNYLHTASTRRGDENPWVPIYSGGQVWTRGGNSELLPFGNWGRQQRPASPGPFENASQVTILEAVNLPADRFDRQIANSNFRTPSKTFSLAPNDGPLFKQDTDGIQLGFSHDFSDKLFFEITGDHNEVHDNSIWSINWRSTFIDINEKLPDGSDNPNYLDAYSQGGMHRRERFTTNSGVRANLAYILDTERAGKYTFNTTLSKSRRKYENRFWDYSLALSEDPRAWQAQDLQLRYYWGEENRTFDSGVPTSLFDRSVASDSSYTTSTVSINPRWVRNNWWDETQDFESGIVAVAAEWFDKKLVGTAGIRLDRQTTSLSDHANFWGGLPDDPNWDGVTLTDAYWKPDAPADWKDLTYIPKDADGNPLSSVPLPANSRPTIGGANGVNPYAPQYANDRFRNDYNPPDITSDGESVQLGIMYHATKWFSVHANRGTSYQPRGVNSWLLDYSQADPEEGVATDLGATINLFEQRLAIKVGQYENIRENVLGGPPTNAQMNALFERQAFDDGSPEGRNNLGIDNVPGGDYAKQKNSGYEIEIVGAITPNWRVTGNFGTGRIDTTDRWLNTQAYVDSRAGDMLAALEAAGGMLDTSRKPDNAPSAPGLAVVNPDIIHVKGVDYQQGAANNYNNVWISYDQIPNLDDTIGIKRMKINFFTDYTFSDGRLKGLRLGIGAQYTDQNIAGYRSGDSVANPDYDSSQPVTADNRPWMDDPNVDLNTPVWIDQPLDVTGTIGYGMDFKGDGFFGGKRLELQLVIRNLFDTRKTIHQDEGVALRPPNGDFSLPYREAVPSRIGLFQKPINFELTGRLKF